MSKSPPLFAAGQILGDRQRQEDAYAMLDLSDAGRERLVLVAADGMGGHPSAAEVARLTVERFCESVGSSDGPLAGRLQTALTRANNAIAAESARNPKLEGAGCTLLSAVIEGLTLSWISVGDCSLSLFRAGQLRKLNDDHSMRPVLAEMIKAGHLSAKAAARHPRRHSLRSALTGGEIPLVSRSQRPLPLLRDDSVILGSDGLNTLSDQLISRILTRSIGVASVEVVDRLLGAIEAARTHGQDNATVIFYHVSS